jgi:hypothetical protein
MLSKEQILPALNTSSISWNGGITNFGKPLTISYSFFSELPSYYLTDKSDVAVDFLTNVIEKNTVDLLNPAQQEAFRNNWGQNNWGQSKINKNHSQRVRFMMLLSVLVNNQEIDHEKASH